MNGRPLAAYFKKNLEKIIHSMVTYIAQYCFLKIIQEHIVTPLVSL
jgi:hypothetical protein